MELYKGVVRSYYSASHTADVLLVGSMAGVVLSVPVSQQVSAGMMQEGTSCAVAYLAGGSEPLVVATYGLPAGLKTYQATGSDLTLTTSWQTIPNMSIEVAPPSGQTWTVWVSGQVVMRSWHGTAEIVGLDASLARNGTRVGTYGSLVVADAWEGSGVPMFFAETVEGGIPHTYTMQAKKASGSYTKGASMSRIVVVALWSP